MKPWERNWSGQTGASEERKPWERNWSAPAPAPMSFDEGKESSFLDSAIETVKDVGVGLARGALRAPASLDEVIRPVVEHIPGLGMIERAARIVRPAMGGDRTKEALKGAAEGLEQSYSPGFQAAGRKQWWDEEAGTFGDAWSDWRTYTRGIAESLPEQILSMAPAQVLARSAYKTALEKTGDKVAAGKAAARTAMMAGRSTEAAFAAGGAAQNVEEEIRRIPDAQLRDSEVIKSLMFEGLTYEAAKDQIIRDVKSRAMVLAGVATGVFGGLGDRALAKAIAGQAGGLARRAATGAVSEGLLEEFPQSYLSKVGENVAMRAVDPERPLTQGALNEGLGGLAIGSVQGAGQNAIFGRSAEAPAPENAPIPAGDVLGTEEPGTTTGAGASGLETIPYDREQAEMARIEAQDRANQERERREIEATTTWREPGDEGVDFSPASPPAEPQAQPASAADAIPYDAAGARQALAEATGMAAPAPSATPGQTIAPRPPRVSDQARAALDLAEREREAQRDRELEMLAQESQRQRDLSVAVADAVSAGVDMGAPPLTSPLGLALEQAGINPNQFRKTPKEQADRDLEDAQRKVLGNDPRDLNDNTLRFVARKGAKQAQERAAGELARRTALREQAPSANDQNWAERLFKGERLNQSERRRAIELGFGYPTPSGAWRLTRRATEYRKALREGTLNDTEATGTDDTPPMWRRGDAPRPNEGVRVTAATGGLARLATEAEVPASADVAAGLRVARDIFKRRVVFFRYAKPVKPEDQAQGFIIPSDPSTIYINADATRSHLAIIGHELLHSLRRSNGAVYRTLVARMAPLMRDTARYRAWLDAAIQEETDNPKARASEDLVTEELMADMLGDRMNEPEFWRQVLKGLDRSMVMKIRDAVMLTLDVIRSKLGLGRPGLESAQYIKDLDAARKALAQATADWVKSESASPTPAASGVKRDMEALKSRGAAARQEQFVPPPDQIDTDAFKRWSEGMPVVRAEQTEDYEGGPAVFEAFHGTTHSNIQEIDTAPRAGTAEGWLGNGFYVTTSRDDASINYAGEGPDLTGRIERSKEQLADAWRDDSFALDEAMADHLDKNPEDARRAAEELGVALADLDYGELTDAQKETVRDLLFEKAVAQSARAAVAGDSKGLIMPLWVKMKNPFDMRPSGLQLTSEIEYSEDGEDIVSEGGTLVDFANAIRDVASTYDADASEALTDLLSDPEGKSAYDAAALVRSGLSEAYDSNGELVSPGEIIRQAVEALGYDGIIMDADMAFGPRARGPFGIGMQGVYPGTPHLMPFEPTHVKSSLGNSGAFDASVRNILKSRGRRPGSDTGHKREASSGRYVGAPDWVGNAPQQLTVLRNKLRRLALDGESGRYWYERSSRAVLALVGGDKVDAEKFVGLLAIYSQGTEVSINLGFALEAYYQWKAGLPIKSGRFPAEQTKKAEAWLKEGKDWGGIKTNNFYADLMEEIDPSKVDADHATMDMWMALAFDYGAKILDQGPKYNFAKREVTRLAKELGWKPHQVQAAIWTAIKARVESSEKARAAYEIQAGIAEKKRGAHSIIKGREYDHFRAAHRFGWELKISKEEIAALSIDFADALNMRAAQMSWEATPSVTGGDLPGIHAAPTAQKMEYLEAVSRALHDSKGRNLIAELANLHNPPTLFGFSAWEGAIGAGAQSFFPVPITGQGKNRAVLPVARDLLGLYAAIKGYVLKQDAVVWHIPVYSEAMERANGFQLTGSRPMTEEEIRAYYQEIHDEFGTWELAPGYTANGARVLNFTDLSNRDFQKRMRKVVDRMNERFPDFVGGETYADAFRSDGDYIGNNWTENPDGQDYLSRIGQAGRPDLPGRVADLRARVEAVNRDFAQRYGWGGVREGAAGAAASRTAEAGRDLDAAAHEAATSPKNDKPQPTDAQKEAGNYPKGHVRVAGLDVSIENPAGSRRRPEWPPMKAHYGYIRGTVGKDKDHVDIFIKPGTPLDYDGPVYVVDQTKDNGHFDEHKVMLGWPSVSKAREGYLANYTSGWDRYRAIVGFENPAAFKAWLDTDTTVEAANRPLLSRGDRPSIETAEFKRWFGDSKVVDAEGKPLVVMHASTYGDITQFDRAEQRFGKAGFGFYFSDAQGSNLFAEYGDRFQAAQSFDGKDKAVKTYPVYLNLRNPLVVDHVDDLTPYMDAGQKFGVGRGFSGNLAPEAVTRLEAMGYDGIITRETTTPRVHNSQGLKILARDDPKAVSFPVYVAFRPEQIKSAIGNSGAFDPNNPNILRSRGDRPKPSLWERSGDIWTSPDGRFSIEQLADDLFSVRVDDQEIDMAVTLRGAKSLAERRMNEIANASALLNRYSDEAKVRVVDGWKRIAQNPLAFTFGRSNAKELDQIANDMKLGKYVRGIGLIENRGLKRYDIEMAGGKRFTLYHVERWEGEDYPGAYVDTSYLDEGGLGRAAYQLALTWAHNNKVPLFPDPAGLTVINTYRRTEQMISAALRLGTTRYMRPHRDQLLPGWVDNPENQLEEGQNLALMILTSYERTANAVAELNDIWYNFESGHFERKSSGERVAKGSFVDLAQTPASRDVGGGVSSLARAAFTRSLAEGAPGVGDFLAGRGNPNLLLAAELPAPLALYARGARPGGGASPGPGGQAGGSGQGAALAGAQSSAAGRAGLAVARGATKAVAPLTKAAQAINRATDAALRFPLAPVAKVTGRLADRVSSATAAWFKGGAIRQQIAHGIVADYGLPEPYLSERDERERRVNAHLRKSKAMIDQIGSLSMAESRVAYLWMQEKPDTDAERQMMAILPADSRATLAAMKEQIDQLGRDAVELGLLSEESYGRNKMAYLHRSYQKHEVEGAAFVSANRKAKAIRAETYRGRGLRHDISGDRLPGVQKGDKYVRMELRDPGAEGELGKLKRVAYVKEGEPIPAKHAGWRNDGVWEARWFEKNGNVGMWRDLSKPERERLGEIEEIRYAFARTALASIQDIETAKFLKWVGTEYGKATEEEVIAAGGKISEASDSKTTLRAYADNEWVEVPKTNAYGTKLKKYGLLAGQFIPGHIWNDIRATVNFRSASAVWRLWDDLLTAWKISKTALSPAVHTNNVMANVVMADLANLGPEDLRAALVTIIDAKRGDEAASAMMERFYDSGSEGGSFAAIEMRQDVIEPILKQLESERDTVAQNLSLIQAIHLARGSSLKQALVALASTSTAKRLGKMGAAPFKAMIDLYRQEDAVFRLAKFMKETAAGKTDREAGQLARKAFLDYSINAPWIQALRRGPLPFIAFTYRIVPILIDAMTKTPWKMVKYLSVGYALNALAYGMLGAAGDEEEERALLPDERSGRTLLVFPRLLRMPWNDANDSPVFLDVRRWIPGGDIMDLNGSKSAIPVPPWMTVGGPMALMIELISNRSQFTGKDIVGKTDTFGEGATKVMDHIAKFLMPNLPLPNPVGYAADSIAMQRGLFQTYSWKAIQAAGTGETDAFGRERNLPQALSSAFGVKLGSYPADAGRVNLARQRDEALREISQKIGAARRERQRRGISDEEFNARLDRQVTRRRDIEREFAERMGQ